MITNRSAAPTGIGSGAKASVHFERIQDTAPLADTQSRWISRHFDIAAFMAPTIANLAFGEVPR